MRLSEQTFHTVNIFIHTCTLHVVPVFLLCLFLLQLGFYCGRVLLLCSIVAAGVSAPCCK